MAALSTADKLPERADYSISHRPPPAVPSVPYSSLQAAAPANDSDAASGRKPRSRANSFTQQIFRLRSSSNSRAQSQHHLPSFPLPDNDAPPLPTAYLSPQLTPQTSPETGRKGSFSAARKVSLEGRSMLRKTSRMRKAEEERLEMERKARMNQPAPSLPRPEPLPGIDTFGGEDAPPLSPRSPRQPASPSKATNFSRPAFAMHSSTPSSLHSSSSPAYALARSGHLSSSSPSSDPRARANGEYVVDNSVSRTESMTHRGRYSYASSVVSGNVSSPRRIRRRKDPVSFNILIIGAKNSGKTSFISLLRHALTSPPSRGSSCPDPTLGHSVAKSSFTPHYLESEIDGERIGVTIWDSAGLEKNIVDLQLREMTAFVESKFEETFAEEQKVVRSTGVRDTHIHCVFLVLDPIRLDATLAASTTPQSNGANGTGLDDDLDLQVLRALWGKTTVIPVISKADTLTVGHMAFLKRAVWDTIKGAGLDPLEALEVDDDLLEEDEEENEKATHGNEGIDSAIDGSSSDSETSPASKFKKLPVSHKRQSSLSATIKSGDDELPYIPMSIISPDPYDTSPSKPNLHLDGSSASTNKIGRRFPWGFADPYDPTHCDFPRLRDSIFNEWRTELRDLSRTKWYESWRTSRLKSLPPPAAQQQRVKGGVTPVAAVPREGLTSRAFSGEGVVGSTSRTVSGGVGLGLSKAERVLGN